jgi:hypothetical protein
MSAAHEPAILDPNRATPGIRIELLKVSPAGTPSPMTPGYTIAVEGLPNDIVFNVWTRPFGHGFHEVASGFRLDEAGRAVSVQGAEGSEQRHLDQMVFHPEPDTYPRGAIWQVALVSVDRKITSFATVVPRPLVGRDGLCAVSLELVSHRGDRFLASGSGFAPGDDVTIESRYSGRVSKRPQRTSAGGLLPPELISHASMDQDRRALYTVKGRNCEVTLEYWWGEPALRGR